MPDPLRDTDPPPPGNVQRLSMPMREGRTLEITAPVPMSAKEFEALEATLKAWKSLLISSDEPEDAKTKKGWRID